MTIFVAMTRLSVNINKIATIRNARGGNMPDVARAALDCERFGAEGITVHPRPDGRHIRYSDVRTIRPTVATEFNIEGNPIDSFIDLVCEVVPDQVTLVPDAHDAITSNAGWDTRRNLGYLREICGIFNSEGIRTSIFIDPVPEMIRLAAETGCRRVELYTEAYAAGYASGSLHQCRQLGKTFLIGIVLPQHRTAQTHQNGIVPDVFTLLLDRFSFHGKTSSVYSF